MFLDDIEDYAVRVGDAVRITAQLVFAVTRAFPWAVGILLICLSAFGFWMESGSSSAPTIQQQITAHANSNGTMFWLMQSQGENPSGFLGLSASGSKKQEADFSRAVQFCHAHSDFKGCTQVIDAANTPDY